MISGFLMSYMIITFYESSNYTHYQTYIVHKQIYHYRDFVFFFIFSTENIFSAHQLIISAHWIHTSRVKCIFNTREEDVHEKINSA